jgi:hypothetical protein
MKTSHLKSKMNNKKLMNNKILFLFLFGIFFINLISAESLGTFKQGDNVSLYQICDNCSYVTLTSINYPNSLVETINKNMTKTGNDYKYGFSNTTVLGDYQYNVCGDKNGNLRCEVLTFSITPSGNYGSSNIVFFIFIIILLYTVSFIGFFGKNIPITILGGMAMVGLGVYTISQGMIIYRDWITNYISYITIGLGALLALWAAIEQIQDGFD